MNKIARLNCMFWIMKICATTLGETAGDLLSMTLNVGYAVSSLILSICLIGVLAVWRFFEKSISAVRFQHGLSQQLDWIAANSRAYRADNSAANSGSNSIFSELKNCSNRVRT